MLVSLTLCLCNFYHAVRAKTVPSVKGLCNQMIPTSAVSLVCYVRLPRDTHHITYVIASL